MGNDLDMIFVMTLRLTLKMTWT